MAEFKFKRMPVANALIDDKTDIDDKGVNYFFHGFPNRTNKFRHRDYNIATNSLKTEKNMNQLLIATQNAGKLREIEALLAHLEIKLLCPAELGLDFDVKETGKTYAQNAALKAQAYTEASGLWALADDSGLEVDPLGGEPGLYSARYAPQPDATDADRRAHLLQNLSAHPRPWTARFRCVVALAHSLADPHFATGICPGEIIAEERGDRGFGYDPIFLVEGMDRTMAELSMDEKNQVSHRARAIKAIIPTLINL
jgi:XTP/dITP diphosphohydrolase